jgi:hypothetical protein
MSLGKLLFLGASILQINKFVMGDYDPTRKVWHGKLGSHEEILTWEIRIPWWKFRLVRIGSYEESLTWETMIPWEMFGLWAWDHNLPCLPFLVGSKSPMSNFPHGIKISHVKLSSWNPNLTSQTFLMGSKSPMSNISHGILISQAKLFSWDQNLPLGSHEEILTWEIRIPWWKFRLVRIGSYEESLTWETMIPWEMFGLWD